MIFYMRLQNCKTICDRIYQFPVTSLSAETAARSCRFASLQMQSCMCQVVDVQVAGAKLHVDATEGHSV
jgi:hypothetical protein